jgi:acyl-coenzyme A synthetase/AMP-(fatty) acid ligase
VTRTTAQDKYPRAIEFVDSLPKTITGKIKKNDLREREYKKSMTQKYCPKAGVIFNLPYIY